MDEYTTLQVVWFVLIAVLWIGYFVLEGFDFGVGMLLRVDRAHERRAPGGHPLDRARVGRQRGLAHRGGRRHLRGLPRVVRDALQRLLPRALPHPPRAHLPRRRVRVLGQARHAGVARPLGVGHRHRQRPRRPAVGRGAGPTSCAASRSTPARVRRQLRRPAEPLRAAGRPRDAVALPRPRRAVPDAAHDGRARGARPRRGRALRPGRRAHHGRLPAVDACCATPTARGSSGSSSCSPRSRRCCSGPRRSRCATGVWDGRSRQRAGHRDALRHALRRPLPAHDDLVAEPPLRHDAWRRRRPRTTRSA